ncbi:MAG TPA: ABC-type transport auxiliary lipoprotein family protein [Rhizomicrobium sp.]|nr:ABC-type transport auxiliary lipoprotein family protein [Rhizomicrobium sp.]
MKTNPDRRAFLALTASTLAGCSGLIGPPEASPIYVMRPELPAVAAQKVTWSLALVRPNAPGALDTDRIAILQPGGVMDYYAKAQYADALPSLVETALLEAFERSAALPGVGRTAEGIHSDYHLYTDIKNFEARYNVADGVPDAVVTLAVRLVTSRGRISTGITTITKTVAASSNTIPAATTALGAALAGAAGEIVRWALAFPAPPTPPAPT